MTDAALVARIYEQGAPDVLKLEEVDLPPPGPGEARIAHTAIGLNFADIYLRRGDPGPHSVSSFPAVPGTQGAGRVEAVGEGVTEVRPGDRVAYVHPEAYATVRNVPAARLVALPDDVADDVAAATLLRAMTADYLVHRLYPIREGDWALVSAAAGGVGLILSRWARALGATVIGTAGGPDKVRLAREGGCHHVIDYRAEDFVEGVRRITDGAGVHVVYDSVGRDTFIPSLECLRPMGMGINYGTASGPVPAFPLQDLHHKSLIVSRPTLRTYIASRDDLVASANRVFAAARDGTIRLDVGPRYDFRDVVKAHDDLEARRTTGAPVLVP
ncbi:quinone oxidoreductase family protein [Acuticoccus sp.]|uniref:quinone oxidoreductase family protein n=1 Tax=Acuticoccus sp. TaxID=1904378 RepID=UPI003B51D801